jgi:recombination protein RecA
MSAEPLPALPWTPPPGVSPDGSPALPPEISPLAVSPPTAPESVAERKRVLEGLLRARKLQADEPPLRVEDYRQRPLSTGVSELDTLLAGGFPRGELSEIHGPASSGRTGVLLALLARTTAAGALAALVDPLDRLDPASAAAAGVDLERLLWLRGPRVSGDEPQAKALAEATKAVATLVGAGLFDVVALDLAGAGREPRRLPFATWQRLERLVEHTKSGLVLLAESHVACSPGGRALALEPAGLRFSGPPGPACLLQSLAARARAGGHRLREAELTLAAV